MTKFVHNFQDYQLKWERKYQQLFIKFLRTHETFDGSEVSAWMRKQGLHEPEHHNMWGAQISYYAARGWMTKLERVIPKNKGSHLGQVRLWIRA